MRNRLIFFTYAITVLLLVVGFSSEKSTNEENDFGEETMEKTEETANLKSPPKLTVSVDGDTIEGTLGTHSWSYDNSDGTSTGIDALSASPQEIVKNQKPTNVNANSDINLNFEKPPTNYEVRIWGTDNTIKGVYDKLVVPDYKGIVIYEVLANWEQGTATYVFLFNVE